MILIKALIGLATCGHCAHFVFVAGNKKTAKNNIIINELKANDNKAYSVAIIYSKNLKKIKSILISPTSKV